MVALVYEVIQEPELVVSLPLETYILKKKKKLLLQNGLHVHPTIHQMKY